MPAPILELTREMLRDPITINLARKAAPAVGITQAIYPVNQELKSALLLSLLQRGLMKEALVFTRTKHRDNRQREYLTKHGVNAARIHGNRSQAQRPDALAGFKSGDRLVPIPAAPLSSAPAPASPSCLSKPAGEQIRMRRRGWRRHCGCGSGRGPR